jgi:hypothetical protein
VDERSLIRNAKPVERALWGELEPEPTDVSENNEG